MVPYTLSTFTKQQLLHFVIEKPEVLQLDSGTLTCQFYYQVLVELLKRLNPAKVICIEMRYKYHVG